MPSRQAEAVAWMMARAEAARIASLMQSTFSASHESATKFAETLFGPLETWLGYLALAGIVVAALGAIVAWRLWWRSPRRTLLLIDSTESLAFPQLK